ncbi:MAG: hypothetical protein U5M50_05710 [Sphingobium sp.]|nr:hypothetical protein [Sphingobium sp.]
MASGVNSSRQGDEGRLSDSLTNVEGWIDTIDDLAISGWAIDMDNPLRPVRLELTLFGEVIVEVTPNKERTDIVKMLGFPVRSGFQFSLDDAASDIVSRILAQIKQASTKQLPFVDIVAVQVKGTDIKLPLTAKLKAAEIDVEKLGRAYDRLVGDTLHNNYITMRDALLQDSTRRCVISTRCTRNRLLSATISSLLKTTSGGAMALPSGRMF